MPDKPSDSNLPGGQVFEFASLSPGGAIPVAVGSEPGLGMEGTIKVRIVVDASGKVRGRPKRITRLGHGLDQLEIRWARKLRFRPAIDSNDSPVPATVVWTFNFTLPR